MDIGAIIVRILEYFWAVFKHFEIIPADLAAKIEEEAKKDAE